MRKISLFIAVMYLSLVLSAQIQDAASRKLSPSKDLSANAPYVSCYTYDIILPDRLVAALPTPASSSEVLTHRNDEMETAVADECIILFYYSKPEQKVLASLQNAFIALEPLRISERFFI